MLTVHGSMDQIVAVTDAFEFAKFLPNHKLHIIQGADHEYTSHQGELASVVLDFVKADFHGEVTHDQLSSRTRIVNSRI